MIKSMPAPEFLKFIHDRDFPQEEHTVYPSVDAVQVMWNPEHRRTELGPDVDGDTTPMTKGAANQLAWILGIHRSVFLKVPASALSSLINTRLQLTDQLALTYALVDGEQITSWVTGGTKPMANTVLLEKIAHAFGQDVDDLNVWHISDSPDLTRYNVPNPDQQYRIRDNDHVLAGIAVQNSASWIMPFRLGIYIHHVGDASGAIGNYRADTHARRRTREAQNTWVESTLETLNAGMDNAADRLVVLKAIPMADHLEAFVQSLFVDMRYPLRMKTETAHALARNPVPTLYDAWRIVAWQGSELEENAGLTDKLRYRIMEIASELADQPNRCPTCFRMKI